jgi:hypothetical protein
VLRRDVAPEAIAALIAGGIIGAEVQHYQDPDQIDLRGVLDTLVLQLEGWLAPSGDEPRAAATGGVTHG